MIWYLRIATDRNYFLTFIIYNLFYLKQKADAILFCSRSNLGDKAVLFWKILNKSDFSKFSFVL